MNKLPLIMAGCTAWRAFSFAAEEPSTRPNILFILTDDQRYDALGFLESGFPFLQTPNLDRIAREGAHLRNAFVTTSLCCPSRASFLTGMYAHKHGVLNNYSEDIDTSVHHTFPQLLQTAGYQTAFIGKWHIAGHPRPRQGFDYWLSFKGQGHYFDPPLNENGRDFKENGYITDILTDYAANWLKKDRTKPFCMILSHKAAHAPFSPAPRHRDAFENKTIPEPANYRDTYEGKPQWYRGQHDKGRTVPDKIDPAPWNDKNPRWLNYYRSILAVDDSVGRVLDTLQATGQLDNTVVVFAGDNGFFVGSHAKVDKRLIYEESIRIPLLIRYPKRIKPGSKVDGTVLNIDLAPTLLELAGEKIPEAMQGRSMLPVFAGQPGHRSFLYQYFRERRWPKIPLMLGVRTDRWKYCRYPDLDDIDELYDLVNDPGEMRNLAQNPAFADKLAEMKTELERLKEATDYPDGVQLGAPLLPDSK